MERAQKNVSKPTRRERRENRRTERSAVATVRNVGIAPRKMILVANLIRGKSVQAALTELGFLRRSAAPVIYKLIAAAKANAVNNANLSESLVVREIFINEGVPLKRVMPRARGRADRIVKRSSHATVVLAEV